MGEECFYDQKPPVFLMFSQVAQDGMLACTTVNIVYTECFPKSSLTLGDHFMMHSTANGEEYNEHSPGLTPHLRHCL